MAMAATESTSAAFSLTEGFYTIRVEKLGEASFYPSLSKGDDLLWSGALTSDFSVAKYAAIRQYHIHAADLVADESRIIKVNPELLIPHPKNKLVYQDDEETNKLRDQLDTEEGVTPYVSEYIVLEDGTIISGHRRNHVITQMINPEAIAKTGNPKIATVPVIVRRYESEADELDSLVKENQYRENKSRDVIINEAAVLLQVEHLRGLERKAQAKRKGESVPKTEQGKAIRIVAERLGFKATDLQNQMGVTAFIEKLENKELIKLWKKVRDQATNAAVELRQIWERDRVKEGLTDAHFIKACELILSTGRLRASNAMTQAKRAIAEEKRKSESVKPKSGSSGGSGGGKPPSANGSPSTSDEEDALTSPSEASEALDEEEADTRDAANSLLQAEVEAISHPDSKERWLMASEQQRALWRLAKEARDVYGDDPSNNRLSKRGELIDRCLQVIDKDKFTYDPFADLTAPNHVPNENHYTVKDDFLKKEGGAYVNPVSGDVYANILWNLQRDCMQALNYWIEKGNVDTMFIVSQASIINLPTCQEIIKRHGMAIAAWGGRLEYEPGEILTYGCYFPKDGEAPKKVAEGNQRYDTVVLFYSKSAEQKLKFEATFKDVALVSFQREMVASASLDAEEYIKLPVWVANEAVWQGYKLRIAIDAEGVWTTYISEDALGAVEEESESFGTDKEAKAFLMSLVLIKKM